MKTSAIEKQNKTKKDIAQLSIYLVSLLIDAQSAVTSVIKQKKRQKQADSNIKVLMSNW